MANYKTIKLSRKPVDGGCFETIEDARADAIRRSETKGTWGVFEKRNTSWVLIEDFTTGARSKIRL